MFSSITPEASISSLHFQFLQSRVNIWLQRALSPSLRCLTAQHVLRPDAGAVPCPEAAHLVGEVLHVVVAERLRRADDLVQVRVHELVHEVDVVELVARAGGDHHVLHRDDVLVLQVPQQRDLRDSGLVMSYGRPTKPFVSRPASLRHGAVQNWGWRLASSTTLSCS